MRAVGPNTDNSLGAAPASWMNELVLTLGSETGRVAKLRHDPVSNIFCDVVYSVPTRASSVQSAIN